VTRDIKPPRELDRYLIPTERIVLVQRKHWVAVAGPALTALAGLILVLWIGSLSASDNTLVTILFIGWLVLLARAAWFAADWYRDVFVATSSRLLETYGIITRRVAMMPLSKVTDMSYNRSPIGKILGYGTFILESAGQDQALGTINFVVNPDTTYRKITAEIFRPAARRATDVRPPPGSGSALPVIEPDDVWWRR
jgi:hypothetical protein